MNVFIFTGLISFLGLYFWKANSFRIIRLKKLVIPTLTVVFILCLIILSDTCVKAAARGLNLWFNVVFPSLFPFFVASELLRSTSLVRALGILLEPVMYPLFRIPGSGSFAFLMGTTSGYPVGAKITSSLRKEKLISKTQAERLLAFSNNSGPLFISGAVAVGMLNAPHVGPFLLACHIAASITIGLIFRFYGSGQEGLKSTRSTLKGSLQHGRILKRFRRELFTGTSSKQSFGSLLGEAVKNSIMTILAVGGFITLFSVIISVLLETGFIKEISGLLSVVLSPLGINKEVVTSIISGFFEITTGAKMASSIKGLALIHKLTSISIIIGWAGLSVHSQVLSIISSTDISPLPYLLGKFLHGIVAGIYTFIGIKIAGYSFLTAAPAFSPANPQQALNWHHNLLFSLKCIVIAVLLLAVTLLAANGNRKRSKLF